MKFQKTTAALVMVVLALTSVIIYQQLLISEQETSQTTTSTESTTITVVTSGLAAPNSTLTITSGQTIDSALGQNGIMLSASVNATAIEVGENLAISVALFNVAPNVNSVQTDSDWAFRGVPVSLWQDCDVTPANSANGTRSYPTEAVVLRGYYTQSNISASANTLLPTQTCFGGSSTIDHVIFEASSAVANITGLGGATETGGVNMTAGPFHLANSLVTDGNWNLTEARLNYLNGGQPSIITSNKPQQAANSPPTTPFTVGVYTVGVADEWGQSVIIHVVVNPHT